MQIALIAGGLEPGKGGVGDHIRLLAKQFQKLGHKCALLSLNDYDLNKTTEIQDGKELRTLRLPAGIPWEEKTEKAIHFLSEFNPDWISLHFVLYSFQKRGFVWKTARYLRRITANRNLHIMMHELWIGMHRSAPLKEHLLCPFQRHSVLYTLKKLHPKIIHTSNQTYQAILEHHGIGTDIVPMFGNIIPRPQDAASWLYPELNQQNILINKKNRNDFWIFGFFGGLRFDSWQREPFFSSLIEAAEENNKQILVISIGRSGQVQNDFWANLVKTYSSKIHFVRLGERPEAQISEFLNAIDFGIAIESWQKVGKSGSVAAMIEHGVPVLVNGDDLDFGLYQIGQQSLHPLIYRASTELLSNLGSLKRGDRESILEQAAESVIDSFKKNVKTEDIL